MLARPKAVVWYKVYCYAFGALNLWSAWSGYVIARDPNGIILRYKVLRDNAVDVATTDILVFMIRACGWAFILVGLVFGIAAIMLARVPDTKRTWTAHLVHIVVGATSCVLTPLCLPLLFAWFKPEVKAYFGVPVKEQK